jgi:hypothetical protein
MEPTETTKIGENGRNLGKYICNKCNFKTLYNSNYEKHLLTAKHKTKTKKYKMETLETLETTKDGKDGKDGTPYMCECGKKYKVRSGLWKHKKNCSLNNSSIIIDDQDKQDNNAIVNQDNTDYKSMFLDAMSQNKEIMELLKEQSKVNIEQSKAIQEMVPKIGNNNNNTTNNKFNLQVFLNEDCKDAINFSEFIENIEVTEEDLENQAQLGYVSGISKLFLENLKELGTNKRPIHCTDKKRNTLYIKEDNEWDKEGSQDQMKQGIFKVQCKTFQRLCAIKDENQEEYSDMDSDFSVKCLNIQRHLTPGYQRETTIGKIIDNVSTNSTIDREPDTQI